MVFSYHFGCCLEVARNAVTIVKILDKVSTFFVPKVTSSSGKKNFITPCVKRLKNILPVKLPYTLPGGCKEVFKNIYIYWLRKNDAKKHH